MFWQYNFPMKNRRLLAALLFAASAFGQTKLSLGQLPGCALTNVAASTPIILALVPNSQGQTQFACFTLSGVTITPATATSGPLITIPAAMMPVFIDGETPGGAVDGKNVLFTLAQAPTAGSLSLKVNGLTVSALGASPDYSISGNVITFRAYLPQPGDVLSASYRR